MEQLLIYLLAGAFVGVIAGLFGVGGGLIIVPILSIVFAQLGFFEGHVIHLAIGSSLATIIFTSLSSIRAHHQHQAVRWDIVKLLLPGLLIGTFGMGLMVKHFSSTSLTWAFGLFEWAAAIKMWFSTQPKQSRQLPGWTGNSIAGVVIGSVSAVMGIGGGTLSVPYLVWCSVAVKQAVGTASALGLPIAIGGALGFLLSGWSQEQLPEYATGYLYWPAIGGIVAASVFTAPLGAKLAHWLAPEKLKKGFAILLAILGTHMIWSAT